MRLVVLMLVVIGLLVALLTWRYWWYTDPKRGLAASRARTPRDPEGGAPPASGGASTTRMETSRAETIAPPAAHGARSRSGVHGVLRLAHTSKSEVAPR